MLVAQALPNSRVTVIDSNVRSLEQGQACAERLALSNLTFLSGTFQATQLLPALHDVDMVVALHACGGLTDAILRFATRRAIPFVVCPCCFLRNKGAQDVVVLPEASVPISASASAPTPAPDLADRETRQQENRATDIAKRRDGDKEQQGFHDVEEIGWPQAWRLFAEEQTQEQGHEQAQKQQTQVREWEWEREREIVMPVAQREVLQRLAESKARHVSLRAMHCINTLRLHACKQNLGLARHGHGHGAGAGADIGTWDLQMLSFATEFSLRNIVLCGHHHSRST